MSLRRRLALLEWARRSHTLIFEDDYDSEYRYQGRPIPALQGLDRAGVVIYAGTFNEVLFPALRLAYLVVPPGDGGPFCRGPGSQHASCSIARPGRALRLHHRRTFRAAHSPHARTLFRKAGRISGSLALPARTGCWKFPSVEAGLQTVGWLAPGFAADRAAEEAARREVEVIPLSRYSSRRFTPARIASRFCRGGRARAAAWS